MRVQQPGCTINWNDRVFSLPVTVPPESLPPEKVLEYLTPLAATATNLINTYERFHVTAPGPREARSAPKAAAAGSTLTVLPRITGNVNVSNEFDIYQTNPAFNASHTSETTAVKHLCGSRSTTCNCPGHFKFRE